MSYKELQSNDGSFNTPKYLFNYLHTFFHFELDPCDSGNNWFDLPFSFNKEQNGLKQEWKFNTFINPPYGKKNENLWLDKMMNERKKYPENNFFILLPAKTESDWFERMVFGSDITIFLRPRISFIKDGKPKHGNNIGSVIFGFRKLNSVGLQQLKNFIWHNEYILNFTIKNDGYDSFQIFAKTKVLKEKYSDQIIVS